MKIWHKGGCHCGAVRFEVRAPVDIVIAHCNCSICQLTGYQHLDVEIPDFRLLTGKDNQTSYRFGTHTADHLFCQCCGIKSFYIPRSNPGGLSINFRCINKDGFKNIIFEDFDGQNWEDNIEALRERT